MRKWKKGVLLSALVLSLIPAGLLNAAYGSDKNSSSKQSQSNNLIILIGNGMGFEQTAAARAYAWHFSGKSQLELDSYQVGTVSVKNKACVERALATGVEYDRGCTGHSNDKPAVRAASVIQMAKLEGKRTGLVTTSDITDEVTAAYAAPNESGSLDIASHLPDSGINVLFGGGSGKFLSKKDGGERPDQSILNDFLKKGYHIVKDAESLRTLYPKNGNALGLFANSDFPFVSDREPSVPDLAAMTTKAIELLADHNEGFVLVVEAGRIGDADQAHDLPSEIQETLEFDNAVQAAIAYAQHDKRTSVVVTANRDAGELTFAEHSDDQWNIDLMDDQIHSSEYIMYHSPNRLTDAKTVEETQAIVNLNTGLNITDQEAQLILKKGGSISERERAYNTIVSSYFKVKWNDHANNKADVGIWAYGPVADRLKGRISHAQIAEVCAEIIGLDLGGFR